MASLGGSRTAPGLLAGARTGGATRASRIRLPWLVLGYAAMALAVIPVAAPIYWMALAAFKTNREIYLFPPTWIPLAPTLENFSAAWNGAPFARMYLNSFIFTVVSGGAKVIQAILCGYAFAYLSFPRKNLVFLLVLAALMIPEEVTVLPNYLTVASFGWVNTYAGLLIPGFVSAFGTFLMRQHFMSLPGEVLDAARIDGAGHLRTLWDVVLPMSRPVVATLILLTAVQRWNEFMWPLIVTNTADMRTLPIGLYFLFAPDSSNTIWGEVMAGTMFVVLPVLVLFLLVQRHIVEGIAAGAVKG